jgi:hypothetical protein
VRTFRDQTEPYQADCGAGMFLWVRLVVEELRYCYSDADLEERAVSLPRGLEEAYYIFPWTEMM